MKHSKIIVHLFILSTLNYTCGFHSMKLTGHDIEKEFKPGDEVNVKTKEGPRYEFILTKVTEDSIKGNDYAIATKDILTIEKIYDDINYNILFGILIGIGILVLIGKDYTAGPH